MTATRVRDDERIEAGPAPWRPATRIAFRFRAVYFGLFCLLFAQILYAFTGVVARHLPEGGVDWQLRALAPLTEAVGTHVFGVEAVLRQNGSGDQTAIWVFLAWLLTVSVLLTLIWTALDRRVEYRRADAWLRTGLRLCLGGQMLLYGFAKAVPTQMPEPSLATLLTPYGDQTMLAVLWNQVGAAPAYQIALGVTEIVAGLLLFAPRTATLGALLSVASMAMVFLLNMTYDVPVKILSFHLLLIGLVLVAPQARVLANVLFLERDSEPARQPRLFGSPRAQRIAVGAQVALGLWVALGCAVASADGWREYGGGAPRPALYGIWDVTGFSLDGRDIAPLITDEKRWRRLVVDTAATHRQRMDGVLVPLEIEADDSARTLVLREGETAAELTYERPDPDHLILRGTLAGAPVAITLDRFDPADLPLRRGGFHWVQDSPAFQ